MILHEAPTPSAPKGFPLNEKASHEGVGLGHKLFKLCLTSFPSRIQASVIPSILDLKIHRCLFTEEAQEFGISLKLHIGI